MERKEALTKAINYLKSTGGDNWKNKDELSRRTESMGFMSTAHAIADIYQKGENPKDLDLQKIDFSLNQSEVRQQINELLRKRGASQFEGTKERSIKSDIERIEKMQEEEKERMQRTKEKVEEHIEEIKEGGKLYEARQQAWDGYKLSNLESEGMFKSLIRAIEFAEAIIEMDEKLEENFEGNFKVLKDRKKQMQKLVSRIEQLNFEASELDQSEVKDDDTEVTQEEIENSIKRTIEDISDDKGRADTELVIEEVTEGLNIEKEATESALESLQVKGVVFNPAPGQISVI